MKFAKREGIMLAYPAEEKRIHSMPLIELEDGTKARKMFHQPKLNGERGRTEWFADTPYIISSYGNDFRFVEHIQGQLKELSKHLGSQLLLDGEVYVHGWNRERIDSALRRKVKRNPDTLGLEFHIFDVQSAQPQYERFLRLYDVKQVIEELGLSNLKVVHEGMCDENNWMDHCSEYVSDGYEGIILRNPFAFYEMKRVPGLLKFKPTYTDKYTIVGVNEAVSQTGIRKGMVGSFTVRSGSEPGSGITFDVGAGKLTHDKRREYWDSRDACVGRELLVKHEVLKTSGQVPIAAVTVDVIW